MKLSNYIYYQIDKGMRQIIKILNEKNYITGVCCEGHLIDSKDNWEIYIGFNNKYDFGQIPTFYKQMSKRQSIKRKEGYFYIDKNQRTLYWIGSKLGTIEEKEKERLELLNQIKEWAIGLPSIAPPSSKTLYVLLGTDKKGRVKTLYSDTVKGDYEQIKAQKQKYGYSNFIEREIG